MNNAQREEDIPVIGQKKLRLHFYYICTFKEANRMLVAKYLFIYEKERSEDADHKVMWY